MELSKTETLLTNLKKIYIIIFLNAPSFRLTEKVNDGLTNVTLNSEIIQIHIRHIL